MAEAAGLIRPTAKGAPGETAIIPLWVPVVVFAHVFAGYWLARTWMLNSPRARRSKGRSAGGKLPGSASVRARPTMRASGGGSTSGGGAIAKAAAAAVASADRRGGTDASQLHGGADQVAIEVPDEEASPFEATLGDIGDEPELEPDSDIGSAAEQQRHEEVFRALDRAPTLLAGNMSVNVSPTTLEWQGVGCSYHTSGGVKEVLADIWGAAQPGEMQALLGPSGAGKSTFMDILAMRKSVGLLSGRLLVNGERATKKFIKKTAYVPQEDNFVPTMTAWEVMSFYADIILPSAWSKKRRHERVNEVLAEVGLSHAHRTIVGGTLPGGLMMRGLSGGERRRLAIATGILAAPSILFLDEPTSGLDSFAALTVMGYLKRMVREQNHVVVASIHQPRSAIWLMFDAVTLLASGRLMFHGPREGITDWFGSLGYNYDPSLHGVPSDWALDLVAIGFTKPARFYGNTITTKEGLMSAAAAFKTRYIEDHGLEDIADAKDLNDPSVAISAPTARGNASVTSTSGASVKPAASVAKFATTGLRQYKTLLGRELLSITRNPFDVAGRTLTFTWVGILMGILYYGLPYDAGSARSRTNLVFQILSFYCLMPYISMGLYTSDKKFYLADASSQLYRPLSYYLAKISAITPFQIISACVFGFTVYGMAGLRSGAGAVLKAGLINTLMYLIASQVLHCSAVIAPNQDVAFMISILWTTIQLLLSGFFVNFPEVLLSWITYLKYISATYYAFEANTINEFAKEFLSCAQGLSQTDLALLLGAFPNAQDTQRNQVRIFFGRNDPNCVMDTSSITTYFQFWRPFWMSTVILLAYLAVMHVLTFGSMLVASRRERR